MSTEPQDTPRATEQESTAAEHLGQEPRPATEKIVEGPAPHPEAQDSAPEGPAAAHDSASRADEEGGGAAPSRGAVNGPTEAAGRGTFRTLASSVGLVLLGLLLGAVIFAVIHRQRSNTSATTANSPTPPAVPTQPPAATPVIRGGSVAAIINGHSIPTSIYRVYLNLSARPAPGQPPASTKLLSQRAMNQVLLNELVREYAQSHTIRVSSSYLDSQVSKLRVKYGGQQRFQQFLASNGLDVSSFRVLLAAYLLERKVADRVTPAPKRVPSAHVRHILVALRPLGKKARTDASARALATSIFREVQAGGSFAAIAQKKSDDRRAPGGDLRNIFPGFLPPQLDHAVFSLPPHRPALVHFDQGYDILEVISRGAGAPPPQLAQRLQGQAFAKWVKRQMKAAKIKRLVSVT